MTDSQELILRMVTVFPALEPLLTEHLEDMEGELLPYLILADVARWAQREVSHDPQPVAGVVDWLEQEFKTAEAPERDLIALGFVEAIPYAPEGDPLLALLGPALREVAQELGLFNQASDR